MSLPTARNIVLGSGRLFFDAGAGELYLAETPGFELTVSPESTVIYSDDGPVAETLVNVSSKVDSNFAMSTKNITDAALAMFLGADVGALTTTAASVTAKAINGGAAVAAGHWYQLGVDTGHPAGVRALENVAIKTGATVHTPVTDYVLDADLGRIYIVPGGGCVGDILTSDYDTTAVSWSQISTNDLGPQRGALRYIADNTAGENRDVYVPMCVMEPNGTVQFKNRGEAQSLGFNVKVEKPTDGRSSVYVNSRAA